MSLTDQFLAYQQHERVASPYTLRNYSHALEAFEKYYSEAYAQTLQWEKVNVLQARDYVIELQRVLERRTVHNRIAALRSFYRWGIRQGHLKTNPFKTVVLPKASKKLPVFLTETQIERLLSAPQARQTNGHNKYLCSRDSLILELLYGAGLRVSELCGLTWETIDWERGLLKVLGKGRRERLCPPGSIAMDKLEHYQKLACETQGYVFKGRQNGRLSPREVQNLLKEYLKLAELPADLTPHKLRHTFATHMVSHGANLRAVQELLGHKDLSTTQIYAHLTLGKLKEAYKNAHPRA